MLMVSNSKAWIIYQVGHTLNTQGAKDSYLTVLILKLNATFNYSANEIYWFELPYVNKR